MRYCRFRILVPGCNHHHVVDCKRHDFKGDADWLVTGGLSRAYRDVGFRGDITKHGAFQGNFSCRYLGYHGLAEVVGHGPEAVLFYADHRALERSPVLLRYHGNYPSGCRCGIAFPACKENNGRDSRQDMDSFAGHILSIQRYAIYEPSQIPQNRYLGGSASRILGSYLSMSSRRTEPEVFSSRYFTITGQ